jgi:RHS repeat-associated protein
MKKILILSFLLLQVLSYGQDNNIGGTAVLGVTPILRTSSTTVNNASATPPATSAKAANNPTGTSTEVGITEGALSVSLSGGATYSVPIAVPPGINGVTPQISLQYNSQGSNGYVGYGWSIGGLSSITRLATTKYHDGVIDAVDFDNLDRYALDGQRLILKNQTDTYGGDGVEYQTENYSNLKITSYGVSSYGAKYGPANFKVEYPDGSFAVYGYVSSFSSKSDWTITKWQNAQGVSITYRYAANENNILIGSIEYGSIGSNPSTNKIYFDYRVRERSEVTLTSGDYTQMFRILTQINVSSNGKNYRNYLLDYDTTPLNYQRLKSITEKSGDNSKSLNPTVFTYDTTPETISYLPVTTNLSLQNISLTNAASVSGDYNGDGKMDFLLYPTIGSDTKKEYWLINDLLPNNQQGNTMGWKHTVGQFEEIFPVSWLTENNKLLPQQGWCVVKTDPLVNITSFHTYTTTTITPISFQGSKAYAFPRLKYNYMDLCPVSPSSSQLAPIFIPIDQNIQKRYLSGDFNADGLTDVLAIENSFTYSVPTACHGVIQQTYNGGKCFFVNLDKRETSNFVTETYLQIQSGSKTMVADFDGDNKDDIYIFSDGYVNIYTLNKDNKCVLLYTNPTRDPDIVNSRTVILGDYNGDGKIDFMIPKGNNTTQYAAFYADGATFIKTSVGGAPYNTNTPEHTFHIIANDFNNDGKTDLMRVDTYKRNDNQQSAINVKLYKNSPISGSLFVASGEATTGIINDNIKWFPLPIFLSSSKPNQGLELAFIANDKIYHFRSLSDFGKDKLLRTITTGNGVTHTINYKPLSQNRQDYDVIYTPDLGYTETYPYINIDRVPAVQVVSLLEMQSKDSYKKQQYSYYGAVSHVEGLGFLGFKQILKTNWFNNDLPVISNISQYDITHKDAMMQSYAAMGLVYPSSSMPSTFISKTISNYDYSWLPNKVFKGISISTVSYNGLDNTSLETTSQYDTYNNPTITTSISKNAGVTEQTQTTTLNYDNQVAGGGTYYVGRPKSKTTSTTHFGDTKTAEETYTFTNNLLSKIEIKGHLTNTITQDNGYDTFGNLTSKTITATGVAPRSTSYEYDPSGRFMIKSIGVDGLQTLYNYNKDNGWLLDQTNAYGQITKYDYDVWGKHKLTTDYLNKTATTQYTKPEATTTLITTNIVDQNSSSIAKYDDLGQEIVTGSKNIDDTWSYVMTTFDAYGRKVNIGEPVNSITASPTQQSTNTYDEYGRLVKTIDYTGKTTSILYSGLTTVVNDGTKTVTTVKNSLGKPVTVTDDGGTINYLYDAHGNLKSSSYDGTLIKLEYDGWGRKTKLEDPSAGVYTYTYNDLGEALTQTTPKGVTSYTYDTYGNLETKTVKGDLTDSSTTYKYDAEFKLDTTTFDDVLEGTKTTNSFEYYTDRKIKKTIEATPYATFTNEFAYDALGRLEKETTTATTGTKTSSRTIKNTYKNGYHYQILDEVNPSSAPLWQTNTVNARGQLTTASLGNGISISNTYDLLGFATTTKQELAGTTPVNIITLTTDFEPKRGLLNSRANSLFAWNETFKYDALDRLTEFTNPQGIQEVQEYDNKGRITANSSGIYAYNDSSNPKKEYQNTSVDLSLEASSYYEGRGSVFNDGMENTKIWNSTNQTGYAISQKAIVGYTYVQARGAIVKTGQYSLALTNKSATEKVIHADQWVAINNTVDTDYTYSAWVYSNNPSADLVLFMKTDTETGYFTQVDQVSLSTRQLNQWVFMTTTVTVPANIKKLNIRLDINSAGNVLFDDVKIVKTIDATDLRDLNISYNSFKSPVQIEETGVDKLSFVYNDNNSRTAMFYGSLDPDKLQRPLRKYYSASGTMEIKQNLQTGAIEFMTYIGGDGYTAPLVLKSDGVTQEYLYLHRDYQGSILAITNASAQLLEKRLFDAWGNIVSVQDGAGNTLNGLTLIDRGYTGHEHLQSVELIHMNGRLYDPKLHRFLQPDNNLQDPYNTQNYNRYAYVMNNPLMYTDPSGEAYGENPPGHGGFGYFNDGSDALYTFQDKGNQEWASRNFKSALSDIGDAGTSSWAFISNNATSVGDFVSRNILSVYNKLFGGGNEKPTNPIAAQDASSGGGCSGGSGFADTLNNYSQHAVVFGMSFLGTVATNNLAFGVAQAPHAFTGTDFEGTEKLGRFAGDIATILQGAGEDIIAVGAEVVSLGAGTVPAGAVAIHGTTMALGSSYAGLREAQGLRDYFSREASSNSSGSGGNAAKTGVNAVEQVAVHGNSLKSLKPTWGYKLYSADGTFLKNGITNKPIPKARYTKAFMEDKFMIPFKQFPERLGAWKWEYQENVIERGPLNLNMH